MRRLGGLVCLVVIGCGGQHAARPAGGATADAAPPAEAAPVAYRASPLPDLGTRRAGGDWPGFLGPLGTGVSPEKGIIAPWPKNGLRVVWERPVGTGYGMPSVSRGRLFQFDRHGDRARLSCMKGETGEPLWQFEYPTAYEDYYGYNNGPRCCPVVDGDRVYIYGAEGMLHCVRAADGKLIWKVDTRAEFGVVQNHFGVGSTPVVEGDLLIVQVGGSPEGSGSDVSSVKGNGSGVVAFDKYTGKVRYRVSDELASYASPVLATIHGRRWCFVFARGGLLGLEPLTGKIDFHFPWRARIVESVNASDPVVAGDRVFISECYGPGSALLKVRPGGCDLVWSDADKRFKKSMQTHWNTPIYHDGYLYGCSGRHSENAELRCIELATGKVMWSEPDLWRTSLLMVDGYFVCLAEHGLMTLLRVNPRRYEEVSRWELFRPPAGIGDEGGGLAKPPFWAAPVLAHGLMYVRGRDKLVCLELIPERGGSRTGSTR